jgi:peptidoglycan/xylan/chitin deacetylase (PgdA/CDA1 family)
MMLKKLLIALLGTLTGLGGFMYWCYQDVVFRVPVAEKVVAITYDDGPSSEDTLALLAVLAERDVRVTFFLKGMNVEVFPELVRAQHEAGHEIGNHSWSHQPMLSFSKAAILAEIDRTAAAIERITGSTPGYFRAPFFVQGVGLTLALRERQLLSVGAGPNGTDWEVFNPQQIAASILDKVEPGDIILLHDADGPQPDPMGQVSRAGTVAATKIIIDSLREQGYRFVTITELLALADHKN